VAVINKGQIIEVSTPAELGGRATSLAQVSWRENGIVKVEKAPHPTAFVAELSARFGGEVPELIVKRATLEDIYLEMIGGEDA
jgi:ABC-2 type transport system ATP-binding protein